MIILITLLVVLGITLYFYYKRKFNYFAERGIPYVKPRLPFGNLGRAAMFQENMVESIHKLCKENREKGIFGIFNYALPIIIVTDREMVKDVLVKEFSHFHDRGFAVNTDINPLENHLVNLVGAKWKTLRNKLSPTFTSGKLKGMLPLMETCCNDFMKTIKVDEDREMKELFGRLTLHVIGSCTFGITSDVLNSEDSLFFRYCNKFSYPGAALVLRNALNFAFPKFVRLIGLKTWPEDMNRFFFNLVRDGFEMRKNKQVVRNDFLQILLELKEKGEIQKDDKFEDDEPITEMQHGHVDDNSKIILDDTLLTAQAFVFLVGGFETTSTTLAFLCYFLSKNKDIQDKARKEILEVKKKYGDFKYEALKELVYLDACIKETLRLFPPIGMLGRTCNKSVNIGGTDIEKGTFIFIPSFSIHRDPKNFTNPEVFKPERFIEESYDEYTYLPFGHGPRNCIGIRFAMLELKISMAKFLETYSLDASPKMASREPIKLKALSFVNVPEDGLNAIIRKL